jgi:hypothetical protein
MQERATAVERALDCCSIGHIAYRCLNVVDPKRRERSMNTIGRSRHDANPVAGPDQRRNRV